MPRRSLLNGVCMAALFIAGTTGATTPVGTAFTYQGILSEAGAPAAGTFDLMVFLYDASVGGSQVGAAAVLAAVPVAEGRVTVALDFGDVFDGTALWLEIHVRATGTTTYTPLWPRQPLTAAPYAQHAADAAEAALLGGHAPSYYLAWSNLTGVPAELEDGDDDTLATLDCGPGELPKWSGTAWLCSDDLGAWSSTHVVGPVGTPAENGAALIAAVAALPAASETAPLLVHVEPGTYDLGSGSVPLPAWVSLQGSGRGLTTITSAVAGDYGTVNLGTDSELSALKVANTSTGTHSHAISTSHRCRLHDLDAVSDGQGYQSVALYSTGEGVVVEDSTFAIPAAAAHAAQGLYGFDLTLHRVDVVVSGSADLMTAITALGSGTFVAEHVTASATNSSSAATAIWTGNSDIQLTDAQIEASSTVSSASGLYGPSTGTPRSMTLDRVRATATGGSDHRMGLSVRGITLPSVVSRVVAIGDTAGMNLSDGSGAITIRDSELSGGQYGLRIWSDCSSAVDIRHSALDGGAAAVMTIGSGPVTVAGSQLGNGVSGTVTCAGVWDESHVFYTSTCP